MDYMTEAELTRLAFNQNPDAVLVADDTGHILIANMQAELLTGQAKSKLIGQPVENLVPDKLASRHKEHRNHFMSNPYKRLMGSGLDLFIKQGGRLVPVIINLSPAISDSLEGTVIVVTIRQKGSVFE